MTPLPIPPQSKVRAALLVISFLVAVAFVACRKEITPQPPDAPPPVQVADPNDVYRVTFSQVLAKAVSANPELRSFIKAEAVKQFDKDYDILYQAAKDKKLQNGQTLHATLLQYASDPEAFNTACDQLPLLTIYVPELPNFSAESWNAPAQVPMVAVKQRNKAGVSIYDAAGTERLLENRYIPGFPVLVVKTNERVVTSGGANYFADARAKQQPHAFYSNSRYSFSFADEAFDGINGKAPGNNRLTLSIDQQNIDAYNSGAEWQRDYVYYGITPANTTGKFSNHFSEFIASFNFTKPEQLGLISDQTNDPKVVSSSMFAPPMWTDGRFEIRISIFINAKNAVGQELRKSFTATGNDLFTINYDSTKWLIAGLWKYTYKSVTPKVYYPNIEILPWDLDLYGSVWKFAVSEFDPSEEITRTVTNTTTYGSNFEINVSTGEKLKIGGKFGASATTTHTETYQYKTTLSSEDLAEGVLDFRSPVIIGISQIYIPFIGYRTIYNTYEVSTGIVSFSVEPKRVY